MIDAAALFGFLDMFQVCGRVFAGHSLGALQLYTVRQRVMTHMRCLCNEAPYASYSYALRIGRGMLWEEVLRHRDNRLLLGMDVTSTPPAAGAVGGKAKGVTFGPTTVATPAPSAFSFLSQVGHSMKRKSPGRMPTRVWARQWCTPRLNSRLGSLRPSSHTARGRNNRDQDCYSGQKLCIISKEVIHNL